MAFIEFLPRADMMHVELLHSDIKPVSLLLARLVAGEMGEPSLRTKCWSSWYGDAVMHDSGGDVHIFPFALRIGIEGDCSIQVHWQHIDPVMHAVSSLIPNLIAVPTAA